VLSSSALSKVRPYLYHLTAAENVGRIQRARSLSSAAELFAAASRSDLGRSRRRHHEVITIGGEAIVIRDQAPLHRGNVVLPDGWSFDDLVAMLNRQVFFWPGTQSSPIAHGVRHFERYRGEDTRIIRVPLLDLVSVNPSREPNVCRYNSGSPRCNGGRPSPRSPKTFEPLTISRLRPSEVVEVTFSPDAMLPSSTQVARSLGGRWTSLY
jgi:hypothetical protein